MQFNMHESKSWLSVLTEKVLARKKVIIARTGKLFLKLIYYKIHTSPILPSGYESGIKVADKFGQTPVELIWAFEGVE